MFELVVDRGYDKGSVFPLKEGENLVGRAVTCAVLLRAPDISRTHLMIRVSGSAITAENLSRHTTLLDGAPLQTATPLRPGQQIALGHTTVLLLREAVEQPPEPPTDSHLDELPTQCAPVYEVKPVPVRPLTPPADAAPENVPERVTMPSASTLPQPAAPATPAAPAPAPTPPAAEPPGEEPSGDLLVRQPKSAGDIEEPASGFFDVRAAPSKEPDDSFEPLSMVNVKPDSLLRKDPDFEPSSEPVSMIAPGPAAPFDAESDEPSESDDSAPAEPAGEPPSDEPKTRGLSREAMEYIRKQQVRRARIRTVAIVGGAILLVGLLAMLIMSL